MSKILNKKTDQIPNDAVYIGRPSIFGNPFVIGVDGNRKSVIAQYEKWLLSNPSLLAKVRKQLRGKTLVCWCSPKSCHGDVLLRIANSTSLFD